MINDIPVKDYLTPSKIGSFCINPYVGCPHTCKYCYASFMKRFTNHPEPRVDFIEVKITVFLSVAGNTINRSQNSKYLDRNIGHIEKGYINKKYGLLCPVFPYSL